MSQIICTVCATANRANARFCNNCGQSLTSVPRLQQGQVMNNRYTILSELGRGGMGAVYLASELMAGTSRQVVVKEMLDYYDANDPTSATRAQQRFASEAATLVSMGIAGVPQIFDFFSEGGRNYIVMQYVAGENLEHKLTRVDDTLTLIPGQAYPAEDVRHWGVQLCRVLEGLAQQRIVHMDIKPANLILGRGNIIWLVDFGTAKGQSVAGTGGTVGMQKSSIYGTAGYAPPEQYNGQAEARSDVYALASTLYHLLTDDDPRRHPFSFPQLGTLPGHLRVALEKALTQDVQQRVDATTFRQLLEQSAPSANAFRWSDGSVSVSPEALPALVQTRWDEARGYLQGGDWERWFKNLHRNDVVTALEHAKKMYPESNAALDAFVRWLDPGFPKPVIQVSRALVDFGPVPWKQDRTLEVEIINAGAGCLQGSLSNLPPWLTAKPAKFTLTNRTKISLQLLPDKLSPQASAYTAQVNVSGGNGGTISWPVKVQIEQPELAVASDVQFGKRSRGEQFDSDLIVMNKGKSELQATFAVASPWVSLSPNSVHCLPGGSKRVKILIASDRLPLGHSKADITVTARAGKWSQSQASQVHITVPRLPHLWQRWIPVLDRAAAGGLFGLLWFLASGLNLLPAASSPLLPSLLQQFDLSHLLPTAGDALVILRELSSEAFTFTGPLVSATWELLPTSGGTSFDRFFSVEIWIILGIAGWLGILFHGRKISPKVGFFLGGIAFPWLYAFSEALSGSLVALASTLAVAAAAAEEWPIGIVAIGVVAVSAFWWAIFHRNPNKRRPSAGLAFICCLAVIAALLLLIL